MLQRSKYCVGWVECRHTHKKGLEINVLRINALRESWGSIYSRNDDEISP